MSRLVSQRVALSSAKFSLQPVTSGIPQVYILGSIMLNINGETECILSKLTDNT